MLKPQCLFLMLGFINLLWLVVHVTRWSDMTTSYRSAHVSLDYESNEIELNGEGIFTIRSKCACRRNETIRLVRQSDQHRYAVFLIEPNATRKLYELTERELFDSTVTCGMFGALRRGRSQRVVSYSLFGRNRFYYAKIHNVTRQIRSFYPDFSVRIYHDRHIDESIVCETECGSDNVDFCNVNRLQTSLVDDKRLFDSGYVTGTMWRFLVLGDDFVDVAMFRDSDSYILQREVDAVDQWLESRKSAHIMRDHPGHGVHILAGMWGFRTGLNRPLARRIFHLAIDDQITKLYKPRTKSSDQDFLRENVYDLVVDDSIIHDSFTCRMFAKRESTQPWPTKRQGNCFVGSPGECSSADDAPFHVCPVHCRPKNHTDWTFC